MILIRTDHDSATHYLYEACKPIIDEAKSKKIPLISVEGDAIQLDYIRKRIEKSNPKFIFFNGHGSESSICDNKKNELITEKEADIFSKTIVFARSCNCLRGLGREAVRRGCNAFIGYKRNFWISHLDGYMSRPMHDAAAKPVLETSNMVAISLMHGSSVRESLEKSRRKSQEHILELIYRNDPFMSATISALMSNLSALDYYGDEKAVLGY